MIHSILCFLAWGIADLFYKKSNDNKGKYSDLKTTVAVGIVMGIHMIIFWLIKRTVVSPVDIVKYLPISLCYILSMFIGYKGLKYIELSISSPVQNTSGVITSLLLVAFFHEILPKAAFIAFILILVGILGVSFLEKKENRIIKVKNKHKVLAITLPVVYCLIDGLGTFLDSVYIDKLELISEDAALISYELTFFITALILIIFLRNRKQTISIINTKTMYIAAIFETIGQFFYVYAIADNSTIATSIVGSYCILSMILSSIFLKEKLSIPKYAFLFIAIIGIVILAFLDV